MVNVKAKYTREDITELIESAECAFCGVCDECPVHNIVSECGSLTTEDVDMVMNIIGNKEFSDTNTIKIKYFTDVEPIEKINKGDWIDLRAAERVELKAGEYKLIPLGVGMVLPEGYEANIVPRSSTFKKWGIIQTNSFAVIDNSYSGDNDQWFYPVYATRDTVIEKNDRICQFRLNEIQKPVTFEVVKHLNDTDRGGFGSTGSK